MARITFGMNGLTKLTHIEEMFSHTCVSGLLEIPSHK